MRTRRKGTALIGCTNLTEASTKFLAKIFNYTILLPVLVLNHWSIKL